MGSRPVAAALPLNAMLCKRALVSVVVGSASLAAACSGDAQGSAGSDVVRVPADLCALLSAADISDALGRPFPAPRRFQAAPGEQDCTATPTSGAPMSFTLFWGNCADGKEPNMDCLNSVSGAFDAHRQQSVSPLQPLALGDHAYCSPGPFASAEVLKRWRYLTVVADTCPQAQTLARTLLTKLG